MPWIPELFTAPELQRIRERAERREMDAVPYYDGLLSGETRAMARSFAGEPELHHPIRGRVKGAAAFERFMAEQAVEMRERAIEVEPVDRIADGRRTVEEVLLHLDGPNGRFDLPVAIAADHAGDARLVEVRVYFSTWPLTGTHAIRPPLLQPDPGVHEADVVGEYQRALAAGDVEGVLATLEPDASIREPAGGAHVHRGAEAHRRLFEHFFSNGGGIPLEHCTATDDGRACALEYNVVAWGRTPLPPEAGIAVYVRGASGRLAAARIYDDTDPPLPAP